MALKDHSLDDKITAAAMKEFSAKGYNGASLRKIAEGAGVTVGAIQTRYKSKDELFAGLLKPLLDDIGTTFQSVKADYYSGAGNDLAAQLTADGAAAARDQTVRVIPAWMKGCLGSLSPRSLIPTAASSSAASTGRAPRNI